MERVLIQTPFSSYEIVLQHDLLMRHITKEIFKKIDKSIIKIVKKLVKNNHIEVEKINIRPNANVILEVKQ